jgi:hypothetical protein
MSGEWWQKERIDARLLRKKKAAGQLSRLSPTHFPQRPTGHQHQKAYTSAIFKLMIQN